MGVYLLFKLPISALCSTAWSGLPRSWSSCGWPRRRSCGRRPRPSETWGRKSNVCEPRARRRWRKPTSHGSDWRGSWSRPGSWGSVIRAARPDVFVQNTQHRSVRVTEHLCCDLQKEKDENVLIVQTCLTSVNAAKRGWACWQTILTMCANVVAQRLDNTLRVIAAFHLLTYFQGQQRRQEKKTTFPLPLSKINGCSAKCTDVR